VHVRLDESERTPDRDAQCEYPVRHQRSARQHQVWGLGFWAESLGFRAQGLGFENSVWCSGFGVEVRGFQLQVLFCLVLSFGA